MGDALNDYTADQRRLASLDTAAEHGRTALANAREQRRGLPQRTQRPA